MEGGRDREEIRAEPAPPRAIDPEQADHGPAAAQSAIGLLGILLIVGVIRSQAPLVLLTSLLILGVLVSAIWSHRSRERLTYRRYFNPPRIFPGEQTEYVVEITNHKGLPLPWAEIDEHIPVALVPVGDVGEHTWRRRRSVSLGWHEKLILRQTFRCSERGEYTIGPTEIQTGDPLAIFPVRMRIPDSRALVVYPRIAQLDWAAAESRFPFGPNRARPPVLEDPSWFAGIRDYRPGDPRRFVDWKATARRQLLQTRVFTPTTLTNVVVALNVQTLPYAWQGYHGEKLEAAIGVAAALVNELSTRECAVGLAANASGSSIEQFQAYLPPSRRPSQVSEALGLLARISPLPTLAFGQFLRRVASKFPFGASLICVAATLDEATADQLAGLVDRGHAVALFYLDAELPFALGRNIPTLLLPDVTFEPVATAT